MAFVLQNPENAALLLPPEVVRTFTGGPENMIWWDIASYGNHLSQNACSCPCTVVFSLPHLQLFLINWIIQIIWSPQKQKTPAEHPSTVCFL